MRSFRDLCFLSCVLALSVVTSCFAQSLPEVARQQRQKQQSPSAQTPKKVITDDDMPARPDSSDDYQVTDSERRQDSLAAKKSAKSAEQWKKQILAQENVVSSLEEEVTRLSASVHFVEVNRYSNGLQYNQYQAKKQEEVTRLQKQLDSEKKKLADMQEGARRAGFGSAVYEP